MSASGRPPAPKAQIILVVEDEDIVRHLLTRALSEAGYEVVQAVDGMDGWHRFQHQACDLVVTDQVMPQLNGIGLVRRIRQRDPTFPVILISGYFTDPDTPADIPNDVPMIYKPFDHEVLLSEVRRLLNGAGGSSRS